MSVERNAASRSEVVAAPGSKWARKLASLVQKRTGEEANASDPQEALLLLKSFEESSRGGWFWSTDPDGRLTYLTDSLAQSLAQEATPLLSLHFSDVFVHADADTTGRRTLPLLMSKEARFADIAIRAASNKDQRCWSVSGAPQYDSAHRFTGYRGSAIDVTEQRRASETAEQLAKYDPLTNLPNRRRMAEVLDARLMASEHQATPCAVLLIDLDRFKQVNDTLGHSAGDALLKEVGERLAQIIGDRENVFRLGGDEFQVILPNRADRGIIGDIATAIISRLSQPYVAEGSRCIIGASIGVAVAPADGTTRTELLRNADLALYAAKTGGRGRFRFFASDLLRIAEDRRNLEIDLRDALQRGEIDLVYQPIVNTATNCVTGVEALMRWNHPLRGPVPPGVFIPIAEEAGLIYRLGEWAIRRACDEAVRWRGELRVAVNVSPVQFTNDALPGVVASALAASGLSPDRLELEITEGVFLGNSTSADTIFAKLKKIGVRLSLDDFGTGYSSLGYLRTAPFDKIKIDQTFVRAATLPGSRDTAIIAAIVALAEALDMETIAEGVEYMDQLDLIRKLNVSHVQGWVYSKALSCDELQKRFTAAGLLIKPAGPPRQRSERKATYRKVGLIQGHHYQTVIMRNVSETGALIEGISELKPGDLVLVDFGDGQLTFGRIKRSRGEQHGVAFEQMLVDDGNGGLCTSHRVSKYLLNTVGLPAPGDPDRALVSSEGSVPIEELAKELGFDSLPKEARNTAFLKLQSPTKSEESPQEIAFSELAKQYLATISKDWAKLKIAKRDLRDHILPTFGRLRLNEVSENDVITWLASKASREGHPSGTDSRLQEMFSQMWALAVRLKMPGVSFNSLGEKLRFSRRGKGEKSLTEKDAEKLLVAAGASHNRQLKYILSLLMLVGARPGELLNARWQHFDLEAGVWKLQTNGSHERRFELNSAAIALLNELPRWPGCPYLLPNPATKRPYQSVTRSWEVARDRADLSYLELDDIRYLDLGVPVWENHLLSLVLQTECGDEKNASHRLASSDMPALS